MAKELAGYTQLGKIATGGMGVVYLVFHRTRRLLAAAKTPFRQHLSDPSRRALFEQECRRAVGLHHPHLPLCLSADFTSKRPCIIYELLRGESLKKKLSKAPMPPLEALSILAALASGLHYLHGSDLVHRDIKPSNVFLTPQGRPVLLDLGVATQSGAQPSPEFLGTPAYASPEALRSLPQTPASDVYGLGLLLYEMLFAARPFQESSVSARLEAQTTLTPDLFEPIDALGIPNLTDFIKRLLQPNPERRPQSAQVVEAETAQIWKTLKEEGCDLDWRPVHRTRLLGLLHGGQEALASQFLGQYQEDFPKDPWADWIQSGIAQGHGRFLEAVQHLRSAQEAGLPQDTVHEELGYAYLRVGRYLEAHREIETSLSLGQENQILKPLLDWLGEA